MTGPCLCGDPYCPNCGVGRGRFDGEHCPFCDSTMFEAFEKMDGFICLICREAWWD